MASDKRPALLTERLRQETHHRGAPDFGSKAVTGGRRSRIVFEKGNPEPPDENREPGPLTKREKPAPPVRTRAGTEFGGGRKREACMEGPSQESSMPMNGPSERASVVTAVGVRAPSIRRGAHVSHGTLLHSTTLEQYVDHTSTAAWRSILQDSKRRRWAYLGSTLLHGPSKPPNQRKPATLTLLWFAWLVGSQALKRASPTLEYERNT